MHVRVLNKVLDLIEKKNGYKQVTRKIYTMVVFILSTYGYNPTKNI